MNMRALWLLNRVLLLASLFLFGAPVWAMQQAFLIQNSGWMEPFYTDPSSQFKPLATAVIRLVAAPADTVFVSAFNQTSGANQSPLLLWQGTGPGAPEQVLAGLGLAVRNQGGALADTDFQEAITKVITQQFRAQPGIIWIFTNNRNSPNNDARTALRNQDFYRLLHLEPAITRTVVFPLSMPVQGRRFSASGMMVYALAYGDAAGARLAHMVQSGQLGQIFTSPPVRLKPLDQESVRLVPVGVADKDGMAVSLGNDGRTLILDVHARSVQPQVVIQARLENLLYPYVIAEATASASMVGAWGRQPVPATPERFEGVPPGEFRDVTITLPMPLAQVPAPWSRAALAAMGKQVLIPAALELSLEGQRLVLAESFRQSLLQKFPGDPMPDVLLPPDSVRASAVTLPMVIRVQYPLLPVLLLMLASLALLLGLGGLAFVATRSVRYSFEIDGAVRAIAIKAFRTVDVKDANGAIVGRVSRGLGVPKVVQVEGGHTITVRAPR